MDAGTAFQGGRAPRSAMRHLQKQPSAMAGLNDVEIKNPGRSRGSVGVLSVQAAGRRWGPQTDGLKCWQPDDGNLSQYGQPVNSCQPIKTELRHLSE